MKMALFMCVTIIQKSRAFLIERTQSVRAIYQERATRAFHSNLRCAVYAKLGAASHQDFSQPGKVIGQGFLGLSRRYQNINLS